MRLVGAGWEHMLAKESAVRIGVEVVGNVNSGLESDGVVVVGCRH